MTLIHVNENRPQYRFNTAACGVVRLQPEPQGGSSVSASGRVQWTVADGCVCSFNPFMKKVISARSAAAWHTPGVKSVISTSGIRHPPMQWPILGLLGAGGYPRESVFSIVYRLLGIPRSQPVKSGGLSRDSFSDWSLRSLVAIQFIELLTAEYQLQT